MPDRCAWCGTDPLYIAYHDLEWGVPNHDDRHLFEMLVLEGAQAGLSWITILRKRENYRRAFEGFDAEKVALYTAEDVERLMTDAEMHLRLAEQSGNRYLVRLLAQTFERITLKRRIEGYRADRGSKANADHLELLNALKANDLARAEKSLRAHVSGARDALLNTLEERPTGF
jgi:DNA-binding GntR family transcriptional regulator